MEISAAVVAELRRETGAGLMDCKRALQESNGDPAKALEYLRKKGKAAAEKRAERSAQEGIVAGRVSDDGRTAGLVEVNSETDFVARNESFRKFGDDLAQLVLNWPDAEGKTVEDLKQKTLPAGLKVVDGLMDLIGSIRENLVIRRFARVHADTGYVGSYIHQDSKLGVLVVLDGVSGSHPRAHGLGRDLAMQIAAASPDVVRRDEIPADKISAERAVEMDRARNEGKPEAAVAKIAEGRINKWFSEVVLLEQPFVKDPKVIIKDVIAAAEKEIGHAITVKSFVRLRVGA